MWPPLSDSTSLGAERPLYLHLLDRELAQSVDFRLTPNLLERVLKCALLGTNASLYCGVSIIWENDQLDHSSRLIIEQNIRSETVRPVSYNASVDEFIESRQILYRHDAERYPLYFSGDTDALRRIMPVLHKSENTTDSLQAYLGSWTAQAARLSEDERSASRVTLTALTARQSEALTFKYFSTFHTRMSGSPRSASVIKQAISMGYTDHYLNYAGGDIITGIKGLSLFDASLARDFPLNDTVLLLSLLRSAGLGDLLERPWQSRSEEWAAFLESRGTGPHVRLARLIRVLLHAASSAVYDSTDHQISQYGVRSHLASILSRFGDLERDKGPPTGVHISDRLVAAEMTVASITQRLQRRPQFAESIEKSRFMFLEERADVLIVTATIVETRAVLDLITKETGRKPSVHHSGSSSYWDLGTIMGARIHVTQCEMGSGGPSGSTLTVAESISRLRVGAVIMVGIAFGASSAKQRIGDVLISKQVLGYELQRVSAGSPVPKISLRGDKPSASPRLLARCRAAAVNWLGADLHFGLLLSGEKLIDDPDYRQQLESLAGDGVVGGEMEGAGLYAAAHRGKVDWIIIKSICDWADGQKAIRKASRQSLAASNSAEFLWHLLHQGGISAQ